MKNVGIIDYGLGNLFSVLKACEQVGMRARLVSSPKEIKETSGIIMPGVGAFSDAMRVLKEQNLIEPLRDYVNSNRPFLAICLGMQLLMTESEEFGLHEGLNLVKGKVRRLLANPAMRAKVPHVGWSILNRANESDSCSFLNGVANGTYMYFVHSYHVVPDDKHIISTQTLHGANLFCSSFHRGNMFACQFHPEKSGGVGLMIYKNFFQRVRTINEEHYD